MTVAGKKRLPASSAPRAKEVFTGVMFFLKRAVPERPYEVRSLRESHRIVTITGFLTSSDTQSHQQVLAERRTSLPDPPATNSSQAHPQRVHDAESGSETPSGLAHDCHPSACPSPAKVGLAHRHGVDAAHSDASARTVGRLAGWLAFGDAASDRGSAGRWSVAVEKSSCRSMV